MKPRSAGRRRTWRKSLLMQRAWRPGPLASSLSVSPPGDSMTNHSGRERTYGPFSFLVYEGESMAVQNCPGCGQLGMTWSIDEDQSPLTQWYCSLCGYTAEEDEKRESGCPKCGVK